MSYPSTDPRDIRAAMHNTYDGYMSGTDLYPRYRFVGEPEAYPRKTQAIAKLIFGVWAVIDEDRSFFQDAFRTGVKTVENSNEHNSFLVLTTIGKNAVTMATISRASSSAVPLEVTAGEFRLDDFVERFEGHEFKLADGRSIVLRNGGVIGDPIAQVVRRSNVTGLFMPRELKEVG